MFQVLLGHQLICQLTEQHINTNLSFMKRDSKLSEKTVLIIGPVTRLTSAIAMHLAEQGADIGIIDSNIKAAENVAQVITDQHEINAGAGRAAGIAVDYTKTGSLADAVAKVAELFGGIDIYIDAMMSVSSQKFLDISGPEVFATAINAQLQTPLTATHFALKFIKGRRNGRLIYLIPDLFNLGLEGDALNAATRMGLPTFAASLSRELGVQHVTANCVAVGPLEEHLLARYPQAKSIGEAQQLLKQQIPNAKIGDPNEIAAVVSFIASPASAAFNGQSLSASYGLRA